MNCCRLTTRSCAVIMLLALLLPASPGWAAKQKRKAPVAEVVKCPEVYLAAPPQFLRPEGESVFLAVEIPYDLFYVDNRFYLLYRGGWFASDFFEGPWEKLVREKIPAPLRSHTLQSVAELRRQLLSRYDQNRQSWPPEARFVPETIDSDGAGDELATGDQLPAGEENRPENEYALKGEEKNDE